MESKLIAMRLVERKVNSFTVKCLFPCLQPGNGFSTLFLFFIILCIRLNGFIKSQHFFLS